MARPREVIGVLPEGFRFLAPTRRLRPVQVQPREIHAAGFSYQGLARLKPGVSIAQANADVERLLPTLTERFQLPPGFTKKMFDEARFGSLVRPLDVDVVGDIGNMLWLMLGTVGAGPARRVRQRRQPVPGARRGAPAGAGVRLALGGRSRRMAWELLSESLLVALLGGVLGVALAYGGIQLLVYLQPAQLPRLNEITLDPIVLLFTLGGVVARGPVVWRDPDREVRASAPGVGAQGQLARLERRPRASSRAQHASSSRRSRSPRSCWWRQA